MDSGQILLWLSFAALAAITPLSLAWKSLLKKDKRSKTWRDPLKVGIYAIVAMLALNGLYWMVLLLMLFNTDIYVW